MEKTKNTTRLNNIIDAIPACNVLADVGCDHGYVGLSALTRGIAKKVVFADVSALSLQKAKDNCPSALLGSAQFVCQDGIASLVCDVAVIAGMGGLEIISILNGAHVLPHGLVLQPMRNQVDVRQHLLDHGYFINSDVKFFDGKFYDLMVATKTATPQKLSPLQLQFGHTNLSKPSHDFVAFLQVEQAKYQQILTGCNDQTVIDKLAMVNLALATVQEDIL